MHRTWFSALVILGGAAIPTVGAESAVCLSPNPADWPQPSKPYVMIVADTSASMVACTNPPTVYPETCPTWATPNACGLVPTRYNDLKCAIDQTTRAFAGQVSFGLATFAVKLESCPASCSATCSHPAACTSETYGCTATCFTDETTTTGACAGCGPKPGGASTRAGAFIRVPIPQDHFWLAPPAPSNVQNLFAWVDSSCSGDQELFASGTTPLNGVLRDMKRYFESGWSTPDGGAISFPSPLDANDRAGAGVNGATACRDLHVVLITDGSETCDTQQDAEAAAYDMYWNGVTVGGKTFKIPTWVVDFAGPSETSAHAIAAAGGTWLAQIVTNEVQLSKALANILTGTPAEVCDNLDNNCNGCTDEGLLHYANTDQTCCEWGSVAQRDACLAAYELSVSASPPDGDTGLLPCTTPELQADPEWWLCYDPGDVCDGVDNNGVDGVDDGQLRCGSPLHCPTPEICNGEDDDCDGMIDDGGVCGGCVPSPEICDGCDNDCDGVADNGVFSPLSCGQAAPPNCVGTSSCGPPQFVALPGDCVPGGGWEACTDVPLPESCDGLDNDCDGVTDEGLAPVPCEPAGTPGGLVYGAPSQCVMGQRHCGQACRGFVGPTPEVTDGVDNDCNGVVDDLVLGTIVVDKTAHPANSGQTFTFTGALSGTLEAGGRLGRGGLAPGSHAVTEDLPAGWALKAIDCDDANSTGDLPSETATFQVEAGETVSCVFTNCIPDLDLPGQEVSSTETFSACDSISAGTGFTVTSTGDVTLRAGQRIEFGDGFTVDGGGALTVEIDAALALPAP